MCVCVCVCVCYLTPPLASIWLPDEVSVQDVGIGYMFLWIALLRSTQVSPITTDERLMTLRLQLAKIALLPL